MSEEIQLVSQVYIKIDGEDASEQVMSNLMAYVVDQHVHMPDMFTLRLFDPDLKLLDEGPFNLAQEIEIGALKPDGEEVPLITGEVTALEPEFHDSVQADFVIRGYDKSHRLYREQKSQAFLNKKDSDLAEEMARATGLQAEVDLTTIVYEHIYQDNQSDLAFLQERAWRIGFECFVEGGTLYFRRPRPGQGAPVPLKWGDNLLTFCPRMTLAEQVDEVVVRGWDVEKQAPIVGQAESGNLYPDIREEKDGQAWSQGFGHGRLVILNHPVSNQSEATLLAHARMDEISGAFIDAEGVAYRSPTIKAGKPVLLSGLGQRFSGTYQVTNATHVYDAKSGFETTFQVRGTRTGLLTEQLLGREIYSRWLGVVTAVVTNADDPQNWGRVKLTFPWMSEEAESDWARVVSIGAGAGAGIFAMPAVGDEVLVAFEHGDFGRPYVLGGMWNGQNPAPTETENIASGEKSLVRIWRSHNGHRITMSDSNQGHIQITTNKGHEITLDDDNSTLIIKAPNGLTITLDGSRQKISIESQGDVEVKAAGDLDLNASGNMNLTAQGQVNVKGQRINLN